MSKAEVLSVFEEALELPESAKSGNLLADELRRRASFLAARDRDGLVGAVQEWLDARDELLTVQAAVLVREFRPVELQDLTRQVRDEVASGTFMKPASTWPFDKTLDSLK
jgi:hypothetical protein